MECKEIPMEKRPHHRHGQEKLQMNDQILSNNCLEHHLHYNALPQENTQLFSIWLISTDRWHATNRRKSQFDRPNDVNNNYISYFFSIKATSDFSGVRFNKVSLCTYISLIYSNAYTVCWWTFTDKDDMNVYRSKHYQYYLIYLLVQYLLRRIT